eukprot:TRINITY_DN3620_c0_g1_i2.p1 TRINITY_DN3620_c0_g1~~TRINITY_DN3620_c0_g1_i2.p1  ORF type:complete len:2002 (+),score=827.22 TRINITY_DN3620_c0_g1_i2:52-6057(+)
MAAVVDPADVGGPLDDRLVHKMWKVRLAAYEELDKLFKNLESGTDPKFAEYGQHWKSILTDNNAVAQEKGLEPLLVFIDRATKEAPKSAGLVCPLLVDKCLGGRATGKAKATEALLLYIEIECLEPVISSLIKGANHKVPKICVASLAALREIVRNFGVKPLPWKEIQKGIPGFFDNADKSVRDEAFALTVEISRWIGASNLKNQLDKLKPVQVKELEVAFEEAAKNKPVPLKWLRSQQALQFQQAAAKEEKEEEIDPFSMAEEVEILSKIKDDWYENFEAKKWTIKKDQLDALIALADQPRLKPGDYHEITKTMKKLLGDANVVVVSKAAKVIALLAKGLRKDYSNLAKSLLPTLFDKFKEKKATVTDPVHEALENMYGECFLFPDIAEELDATKDHKVPKVRQDILTWMTKCLKKSTTAAKRNSVTKATKLLANYLLAALDDAAPEVREAAASTFGALVGVLGERALQGYLNKLDKIKLEKVKTFFPETPVVVPVAAPVIAAEDFVDEDEAPKKSTKKAAVKASKTEEKEEKKAPAKAVKESKPASKASAKPAVKAAPEGKKKKAEPQVESFDPILTYESALEKIPDLISESTLKSLSSANWKERVEGVEQLSASLDKLELSEESVDVFVRQTQNKPSWKDNNVQVLSNLVAFTLKLVTSGKFSKGAAAEVIESCLEKAIVEPKVKASCFELLSAIVEVHTSGFVFSQFYRLNISKHKNVKVTTEIVTFMGQVIDDFGIATIQLKTLIDFIKECLESTNPTIKTQSIKLLVAARKHVGPPLRDFISDVKPALLNTIDEEFSKVKGLAPAPTKTMQGVSATANAAGGALPREDISSQISAGVLKNLNDADWKQRKEGLEEVAAIINAANKRIGPNLGGLIPAMKGRVSDSNKNLAVYAMEVLGLIATSMGQPIEKQSKAIIPSVLTNFTDNKKNVRDAAVQCLDLWVAETGIDPLLPLLPAVFEQSNTRKDFLAWMTKHTSTLKKGSDFAGLVKPLVSCFEDKSSEVRQSATAVFRDAISVGAVTQAALKKATDDLKPASKLLVGPILEQLRNVQLVRPAPAAAPALAAESSSASSRAPLQKSVSKTEVHDAVEENGKEEEVAPVQKPSSLPSLSSGLKPPGSFSAAPAAPVAVPQTKLITSGTPLKSARLAAERQKGMIGRWTDPNAVEESIKMETERYFDPLLHSKMFARSDVAKQNQSYEMLQGTLSSEKENVRENVDLIIKWIASSFVQNTPNGQSPPSPLCSFLESFFSFLDSEDYHLDEVEVSFLVPALAESFSRSGESTRAQLQSFFKSLCRLFPVSKLFKILLDTCVKPTLASPGTKSEAMHVIAALIKRQGMEVSNPSQTIPAVVQQLDNFRHSADKEIIESGALAVLSVVYEIDGLWVHIPSISPMQKMDIQTKLNGGSSSVSQTKNSAVFQLDEDVLNLPSPVNSAPSSYQSELAKPRKTAFEQVQPVKSSTSSVAPVSMDSDFDLPPQSNSNASYVSSSSSNLISSPVVILQNIRSNDPAKVIEALKLLSYSDEADLVMMLESDKLIEVITSQLRQCYSTRPFPMKLYKCLLLTLDKIFSTSTAARSITKGVLSNLLRELIETISRPALEGDETTKSIPKAINHLILKILENSEKTAVFVALLSVITRFIPSQLSDKPLPQSTDVAIKCVVKLSKMLQASPVEDFNVQALIDEIHSFLETHPPQKWKGRNDLPLKVVKTILLDLVTKIGPSITSYTLHLSQNPPPAIVGYINLMLKGTSASSAPASAPVSAAPSAISTPKSSSVPSSTSGSPGSNDMKTKATLSDIFRKIGAKETTQQGLQELFTFTKENPEIDIQPHLNRTSEHFRTYIKNGLLKIEQSQKEPENRDPNPSTSTDENILDRIKKLQSDYGLKKSSTTDTSSSSLVSTLPSYSSSLSTDFSSLSLPRTTTTTSSSTSSELQGLKDRLKAIQLQQQVSGSTPTFSATPQASTSSVDELGLSLPSATTSSDNSLSALRAKLAHIKSSHNN